MENNTFSTLNAINVNDKTEKKNGLTYLSWALAWAQIKEHCPDARYTIYENAEGLFYHHDGRTAWVKTGLTIGDIEYIEYLPVMDHRNKSIALDSITSFDVNKTIQRSLTKAAARHGLGLYIYAGEDLPEGEEKEKAPKAPAPKPQTDARPWLNKTDAQGNVTETWTKAESYIKGGGSVADIEKKYKLSKAIRADLEGIK